MAFSARSFAVSFGMLALTNAHAVMNTPKPYGFGSGLQNGPMTQAAFPCKKGEVQFTAGGDTTTWTGGQPQLVNFATSAVHGGGKCFVAMTYETPGSAGFNDPANWKNVYDMPGDCPATTAGNLETTGQIGGYPSGTQCSSPDSSQAECVHSFNVPMNDALKDGQATFGWVWLSKVTTETYMNCAPITISGAKNNGGFDALPSLTGLSFTGISGGGPPGGGSSGSAPASGSSGSSSGSGAGSGSSGSGSSQGQAPKASKTGATSSPTAASGSGSGASGSGSPQGQTPKAAGSGTQGASTPAAGAGSSAPSAAPATGAATGSAPAQGSSGQSSGGACTDGATKCDATTWSMCSNGAYVSMGSISSFKCVDNKLTKRTAYKAFQG